MFEGYTFCLTLCRSYQTARIDSGIILASGEKLEMHRTYFKSEGKLCVEDVSRLLFSLCLNSSCLITFIIPPSPSPRP